MTYNETLDYLYTSIPVFQHTGASAYKPGLGTSNALDEYLKFPHRSYKTIHVAGTNGKGSISHLLAAILQCCGYRVGLFTSPHLTDFRERIRVNGEKISEKYVIDFVERYRSVFEPLQPSFFELTSTMAFAYFRFCKVDYAVIEVGLGGRLDSTNIINPILSVITNISYDHTQFLGTTLEAIAAEKAGIIKPKTPVVIGDVENSSVMDVFIKKAEKENACIISSIAEAPISDAQLNNDGKWHFLTKDYGNIIDELGGAVQRNNAATVLTAIKALRELGVAISKDAVHRGFSQVIELTGLMGRWQTLPNDKLKVVCDTGHNTGGWEYLSRQLGEEAKRHKTLRMVVGMVNDKDIDGVLELMPKNAVYYFTQASIKRALPAGEFANIANAHGLAGAVFTTVQAAVQAALVDAGENDFLFIGGSTFVVADALPLFQENNNN